MLNKTSQERVVASLQMIQSIEPIVGADRIEVAKVLGWSCVVRKGQYTVGEVVVYIEVDAHLPLGDPRWDFLPQSNIKISPNGFAGYVLKPVKLRGTKSYGLLIPYSECPELGSLPLGANVQEALGIQIYEPEISEPGAIGPFPHYIPKTSIERWQNIPNFFWSDSTWQNRPVEAEIKLNGKSRTVYLSEDGPHICSKNLDLGWNYPNSGFKEFLEVPGLLPLLMANPKWAIQGELIGAAEGVESRFCVFDIYDIKSGLYLGPSVKDWIFHSWKVPEANRVPVLDSGFLSQFANTEAELLALADGPKAFGKGKREGIVLKFPAHNGNPREAVKVINY